jgi:hypothetical protein
MSKRFKKSLGRIIKNTHFRFISYGLRTDRLYRIVSRMAEIFEKYADYIIFKVEKEGFDICKRGAKRSHRKRLPVNKLRI